MLLFIGSFQSKLKNPLIFQYISCYCLSQFSSWENWSRIPISIHLMLLFIRESIIWYLSALVISIHLMLLFIISDFTFNLSYFHFNTSHVTVYPYSQRYQISASAISIHLMLLFISVALAWMLTKSNFNTSHVTVYRYKPVLYIDMPTFQYISCYCLSEVATKMINSKMHFNTSHVTVYHFYTFDSFQFHIISIHLMLLFISWLFFILFIRKIISIHLMLLFIDLELKQMAQRYLFQYISCYCLSF